MSSEKPNRQFAELSARAAVAPRHLLDSFFTESAKEVLLALARNPYLQERDLLRLLGRKDLPSEVLREIAAHKESARSYGVKLALARHPRTPRLISLPILKFLYLFDLLRVVQTPAVPADVKMAAEDNILKKSEAAPRGEKITLARRASGRVVMGLLKTEDHELIQACLDNPFLTEAQLLKVLVLESLPSAVVKLVVQHPRWCSRYHVRLSLIRQPATPLPRVSEFISHMALADLQDISLDRRMRPEVKELIEAHIRERRPRTRAIT